MVLGFDFLWENELKKALITGVTGQNGSYLAEFCYRFNRRFQLQDMPERLAYVAVRTPPMPMRLLKMAELHG